MADAGETEFRRRWREPTKHGIPPRQRARLRQRRIFLILVAMGVMIGAIAGLFFSLRPLPRPLLVPIVVLDYQANRIPIPAMARRDQAAILESGLFPNVDEEAVTVGNRMVLTRRLDELASLARGASVVIYLSAYAITGTNGELLILPSDFVPSAPATSIPLKAILESIRDCPATRKLLVLDIMRPIADPRIGVMSDDASTLAAGELEQVTDPNRLALVAAAPGQTSLASSTLGRSLFGYYFVEGVKGAADGYAGGGRDGVVTTEELAAFLRVRVDRFATRVYGLRQTPTLIGSGRSFDLTAVEPNRPLPSARFIEEAGQELEGAALAGKARIEKVRSAIKSAVRGKPPTTAAKSAASPSSGAGASGPGPGAGSAPAASPPSTPAAASTVATTPAAAPGATASPPVASTATSPSAQAPGSPAPTGQAATAPAAQPSAPRAPAAAPSPPANGAALMVETSDDAALAAIDDYPLWLADAWTARDHRLELPHSATIPWIDRQWEEQLLNTEQRWRNGLPEKEAREEWDQQRRRLEKLEQQMLDVAHPEPRSLALARHFGRKERPAVTAAAEAAYATWIAARGSTPPAEFVAAEKKTLDAWAAAVKDATAFEIASPVITIAEREAQLDPVELRFFSAMLQVGGAPSAYIEPLFLSRLAALTQSPAATPWPADTIRLAMDVCFRGEMVAADPLAFTWLRTGLTKAFRARHNAEAALEALGYAPLADIAHFYRHAEDQIVSLSTSARSIHVSVQDWRRGARVLPAYLPLLLGEPSLVPTWERACDSLRTLPASLLVGQDGGPLSEDELNRQAERRQADALALRTNLVELQDFHDATTVERLVRTAGLTRVSAAESLASIDQLLATPLIQAKERLSLWNARREVETGLAEIVLTIDAEEDKNNELTRGRPYLEEERDAAIQQESVRATTRLAFVTRLVEVTGVDQDVAKDFMPLLDANVTVTPIDWAAAGQRVRRWFDVTLPATLERGDLVERFRVSIAVDPLRFGVLLDDPHQNPSAVERRRIAVDLFGWLAEYYRGLALDGVSPAFYFTASSEYAAVSRPLPMASFIGIALTEPPTNDQAADLIRFKLSVTAHGPVAENEPVTLDVVAGDPSWRVEVDRRELASLRNRVTTLPTMAVVPVAIDRGSAERASDVGPALGFFAIATQSGSTFHRRIPLTSDQAAEPVTILIGSSPSRPADVVGELRLRPTGLPREFFLSLVNPSDVARQCVVSAEVGGLPVAMLPKVALPPKQTIPLSFGKEAPKPGVEAPELTGELAIVVRDAAKPDGIPLARRVIPVAVSTPRDYVGVVSSRFQPLNPPTEPVNRLSVRLKARRPLEDPPCAASLELPASRIPNLRGPAEGTMRGVLGPPNANLDLFAQGLRLAPGVDPNGWWYLNVDGVRRAYVFRTRFAPFGDATQPQIDLTPAARLEGASFVKSGTLYPIVAEIDNAPRGSGLVVSWGQEIGGEYVAEATQTFPTARREHLGFRPMGPNGGLLFEAAVTDWTINWSTTEVGGRYVILARVLDATGGRVAEARKTVIVDGVAPEGIAFLDPPKMARAGDRVKLTATGFDGAADIASVTFFVGTPVNDAPPPNAVTVDGTPINPGKTVWEGTLPLPADAIGPVNVSVRVANRVGLAGSASAVINVVAKGEVIPGKLIGQVLEASRPQAGLDVTIADAKGKVLATTKTDPNGAFVFPSVAPGTYTIATTKIASGRTAKATIKVEPFKVVNVPLVLAVASPPPAM